MWLIIRKPVLNVCRYSYLTESLGYKLISALDTLKQCFLSCGPSVYYRNVVKYIILMYLFYITNF
jgi:hypothetical protein